VPGAQVYVRDADGRILLQRRADSGNWSAPGGVMELGESLAAAAVREVREETGLDVELTGLLGVYTDPGHLIAYADGEVRQEFVVAFTGRVVDGQLRGSDESMEVRWVEPAELDDLPVHPTVRRRITHCLSGSQIAYFD
jgi:ADP-ribose pyrophosphatase YjhB (NUDIX family)